MSYRFKMIEGFGVYKWTIDFQEHLENSVMFTNVTGGEWKNIRNPRTDAVLHIPKQTDKRADLIAILRDLGLILIAEGKDVIGKLWKDLPGHIEVINELSSKMRIPQPGIWDEGEAASLPVPTLLWCCDQESIPSALQVTGLFMDFDEMLRNSSYSGPNLLVGLEVRKDAEQHLSTHGYVFYREEWQEEAHELASALEEISGRACILWDLELS
jgi:hypothetical protein